MDSSRKPSLFSTVMPTLGYLAVMGGCLAAGLGRVPTWRQSLELAAFLTFVGPVYFTRVLLYERRNAAWYIDEEPQSVPHLWQLGLLVPVFIIVADVVWAAVLALEPRHRIQLGGSIRAIARILVGAVPFYADMWRRWRHWPVRWDPFTFRHQHAFPAFATCLVSFMYAWSVATDGIYALICVTAPLQALWCFSFRWSRSPCKLLVPLVAVSVAAVLTCCFAPYLLTVPDYGEAPLVAAIGVLITLVMGLCQSWRFTSRVREDASEVLPKKLKRLLPQNPESYYGAATNIATAIYIPCFFVAFLHPSIKGPSAILLSAVLALAFTLWFGFQARWKGATWNWLGIAFGLVLPVLVALRSVAPLAARMDWCPPLWWGGFSGGLVVTIIVLAFGAAYKGRKSGSQPWHDWRDFYDPQKAMAVGTVTTVGLLWLVSFAVFLLLTFETSHKSLRRLVAIQITYFVLTLVLACWYILWPRLRWFHQLFVGLPATDADGTNASPPPTSRSLLLIWKSCRPSTSLVAWLIAATGVFFGAGGSLSRSLLISMPVLAVTMAGFLLNDIGDRAKDRLAGRPRPIAQGMLPLWQACSAAIVLLLLSLAIDWCVGCAESHLVALAACLGVAVYTPLAQAIPVAKGLLTGLLSLTPFAYASAVVSAGFPWTSYGALCLFIVGRELLLDTRDLAADLAVGMKTLAYYIGPVRSVIVAYLIMAIAGMAIQFMVGDGARILSIAGFFLLLLSVVYWRFNNDASFVASRFAILLGGIALATTIR